MSGFKKSPKKKLTTTTYAIRSAKGRKQIESLFETAIEISDVHLAEECLASGVNPNLTLQYCGDKPLHILAEKGDVELGEILLQCDNIIIDIQNERGNTPLHIATIVKKRKYVMMLLAYGANPNVKNHSGKLPIHCACEGKAYNILYDLLRHKTHINVADVFGNTPLSLSVIENHFRPAVIGLLRLGANPNMNTLRPYPLLLEATLNCNSPDRLAMIELLVANKVDVNVVHSVTKMSSLHMVAITGYIPAAKFLLEHGASLELRDISGRNPIGIAIEHERSELVNYYLDYINSKYHPILKETGKEGKHSEPERESVNADRKFSTKSVSFDPTNRK